MRVLPLPGWELIIQWAGVSELNTEGERRTRADKGPTSSLYFLIHPHMSYLSPPGFQTIPTLSLPARMGCDPFELRDKNKAFLPEIRLARYSIVGMQM